MRTAKEALREIRNRLVYLYGKIDGTFDPPALKEVCEIADEGLADKDASVCNAAAMREALDRIGNIAVFVAENCGNKETAKYMTDIIMDVQAAVCTPPRNCDVGTAEEQTKRYDVYCYDHRNMENCCGDCPLKQAAVCEIAFGQMPYEAEEGGNDGR